MKRLVLAALATLALVAACARPFPDDFPAAKITGKLYVLWVGEGTGKAGDGRFLYIPDETQPLTLRRSGGNGHGATVTPGVMYTDGGTIPRLFQVFKGLQPWGYAPAYIVHDWLFVARQCLNDGSTDPAYTALSDVTFADSVSIIGEAISGLMAAEKVGRNDVAGEQITFAVGSAFSRARWQAKGECGSRAVDEATYRAALAALPFPARKAMLRTRPLAPVAAMPPMSLPPAKIVAEITF